MLRILYQITSEKINNFLMNYQYNFKIISVQKKVISISHSSYNTMQILNDDNDVANFLLVFLFLICI